MSDCNILVPLLVFKFLDSGVKFKILFFDKAFEFFPETLTVLQICMLCLHKCQAGSTWLFAVIIGHFLLHGRLQTFFY